MTKICPDCKIEYSDDHGFCSQCGHKLEPKQEAPPSTLHIGDANAISGGISIDQSKTVQHHDVYYQTTQERTKTDKEIQQEQQKQYFDAVRRLMQNGVMSGEARIQLNALKSTLFIDERTAMQIEEAVKNEQKAKSSGGELKLLAKLSLDNAIKAVQDNLPNTADHIKKLAPVCRDTTNEQVHYYYYMLLSAFEPQQCVEAYEHRSVDSYWQSFWTSLAYRKLDRETEFVTLLNDLPNMWNDRPETNAIVGFCVGLCLSSQGDIKKCSNTVVEYLNQCDTEPSELLNDLFHALMHQTGLEHEANPRFAFYEQHFLLAGTVAKEKEAEAEREKQALAEKERKEKEAQAERERKERETQAERERKEKEAQEQRDWMVKKAKIASIILSLQNRKTPQPKNTSQSTTASVPRTPNPMAQVMSAKGHKEQGDKYYEGKGVSKDFHEAAKWYRMAANEGNAEAQNKLAYLLYSGQGVDKNPTEAFEWFSKAANQGFLSSQFWVGYLYHTGRGVAQNYAEAAKWYRKAADQGHSSAQRNLGVLYEEGKGVPQSYQEAREWFQKAQDNGYPDANKDLERIVQQLSSNTGTATQVRNERKPLVEIVDIQGGPYEFPFIDLRWSMKYQIEGFVTVEHTIQPPTGPAITNFRDLKLERNGFKLVTRTSKGLEAVENTFIAKDADGVVSWSDNYGYTPDMKIKESGVYKFPGNMSVYDAKTHQRLASQDYTLVIKYIHKFLGKDNIRVLNVELK